MALLNITNRILAIARAGAGDEVLEVADLRPVEIRDLRAGVAGGLGEAEIIRRVRNSRWRVRAVCRPVPRWA